MSTPHVGPGCGRSIEELNDYIETGQSADTTHISSCPECQAGLAALARLRRLTTELVAHDIRMASQPEEPWLREILTNLRLETRAGRDIPIAPEHPGDSLWQTEGSVTALIRNVGDTIEGATIGRCRLHGDLTVPGAPVDLDIRVTAFYGYGIHTMAETLRTELEAALATHTELRIRSINITVSDLRIRPVRPERTGT